MDWDWTFRLFLHFCMAIKVFGVIGMPEEVQVWYLDIAAWQRMCLVGVVAVGVGFSQR